MPDAPSAARPLLACPGCGATMRRERLAARTFGTVDVDACLACQEIWFDAYESSQLTAGAILMLFRLIEAEHGQRPHAPDRTLRCPACRAQLQLTHDVELGNPIVYHRCPQGHGRFTSFFQFLREKNFVRSLGPGEVQRLRGAVAQVRCASCGAPVSLERDAECPHCHAPISILDADAMTRELAALDEQERRSPSREP